LLVLVLVLVLLLFVGVAEAAPLKLLPGQVLSCSTLLGLVELPGFHFAHQQEKVEVAPAAAAAAAVAAGLAAAAVGLAAAPPVQLSPFLSAACPCPCLGQQALAFVPL
jgi:uncharacterized protein YpuA (DUF1002 family)